MPTYDPNNNNREAARQERARLIKSLLDGDPLSAADELRARQAYAEWEREHEQALRRQAEDKLAMKAIRERLERTMREHGCTTEEQALHIIHNEDRLAVAGEGFWRQLQEMKAAQEAEDAKRIGAMPWLASSRREDDGRPFEVKSAPVAISQAPSPPTGSGRFTGLAAAFSNVDSYDDQIERGAFSRTIAEAKARGKPYLFPLLYQHEQKRIIGGVASAVERPDGLWVDCQLDRNTRDGNEAYSLLYNGFLDGMSIGYVVKKAYDRSGVRHLTDVDLLEISLVTFPANPKATVQRSGN